MSEPTKTIPGREEVHPDARDPYNSGYSLANVAEVLLPCLDAAAPESLAEIGAARGSLTRELLAWAEPHGARVIAVDPEPGVSLRALKERRPELELIELASHEALATMEMPDAVLIDGDHNYFTVSEELRLIAEGSQQGEFPLVLMHDVGWPHARRDTYYVPERIPEEYRHPIVADANLDPAEPGVAEGGLPFAFVAAREGGPRNGVLTAIEDFIDTRDDLRLAIIPAFWGFGVLWSEDAPYAERVAEVVEPWDRNPLLARLEEHRVSHLVEFLQTVKELSLVEGERDRQASLLRNMLESSAFTIGERISRFRQRGYPMFSREQVQKVLERRNGDR